MNKEVKEVVRKKLSIKILTLLFFYKGFKEHRPVLRIVRSLMKEEKMNIEMTHQGPGARTQSIFGRTAEYFKYPIQQSPHMKEQPSYLC